MTDLLAQAHASSVTKRYVLLVVRDELSAAATEGLRFAPDRRDRRHAARCLPRVLPAAAGRSSSSTAVAIRSGEGSLQSEVIAFQSTGFRPISRAMRNTAGRRAPYGGRKNFTGAPIICCKRLAGRCQFFSQCCAKNCAPGWDAPRSDSRSRARPPRCAAPAPALPARALPSRKKVARTCGRENVEQPRRPCRVGTVVEGQRQLARARAAQ